MVDIRIVTVDKNDGQRSPVSVQAVSTQLSLPAEYEIAQMLLGSLAECLGFLRRIDPTQPYAEQLVAGRERLYAFTVSPSVMPTIRAETIASWPRAALASNKAINAASVQFLGPDHSSGLSSGLR